MSRRTDDEGAALIIALAVLLFFSLAVTASLGMVDASFRTTENGVRPQRYETYAADGAADAAMTYVRNDNALGRDPLLDPLHISNCPDVVVPGTNAKDVTVTCVGQGGSGVASDSFLHPRQAVLALSGSGNAIDQKSNSTLRVKGAVLSRSGILVRSNAVLSSTVEVGALGACSGNIVTGLPGLLCNYAGSYFPGDPGYAVNDTGLDYQPLPSCSGNVATFTPGYYSDASAVSGVGCRTIVLSPGAYYFDAGTLSIPNNTYVVGGAYTGSSFPGGCDPTQTGAMLVFGGTSSISMSNGDLEVCGVTMLAGNVPTAPHLTLVGQPANATFSGGATGNLDPASATPQSGMWANPTNALAFETPAKVASAQVPSGGVQLDLGGYDLSSVQGDVAMTLTVRHGEVTPSVMSSMNAVLTSSSGLNCTVPLTSAAGQHQETPSLASCNITKSSQLRNLVVSVTAKAKNNNTSQIDLDGAEVAIAYNPPPLHKHTGQLLGTTGSQTRMSFRGTVYAPNSSFDINLTNASVQTVGEGLICSTLNVSVTASLTFAGTLFNVPDDVGVRNNRDVIFKANLDGRERLQSEVVIDDNGGSQTGRAATVTHWNVER
jgi:hypothetical protein